MLEPLALESMGFTPEGQADVGIGVEADLGLGCFVGDKVVGLALRFRGRLLRRKPAARHVLEQISKDETMTSAHSQSRSAIVADSGCWCSKLQNA